MYYWYLRGHSVPTIVLELLDTPADVTRLLTLQLTRASLPRIPPLADT